MQKSKLIITLFILALIGFYFVSQPKLEAGAYEANWLRDYSKAIEQAKAQKKPLLIEFTGSDWCPPCKALHAEVMTQEAFYNFSNENLVLLKADFPRFSELPESEVAQNEKLAGEFSVQGFPTVIVLSTDGELQKTLFRTSGYNKGGSEAFMNELKRAIEK
jgi:thiol-disulfide isomerase/thioredoxin